MMKKLVSTGNGNQWMVQYQSTRLGETQDQTQQIGVSQDYNAVSWSEVQGIPIGITVDGANRHDMK